MPKWHEFTGMVCADGILQSGIHPDSVRTNVRMKNHDVGRMEAELELRIEENETE